MKSASGFRTKMFSMSTGRAAHRYQEGFAGDAAPGNVFLAAELAARFI